MLSVTEFHESLYRAIDKQNSRKEMIQDYQGYLSHGEKWRKHKYIAIENGRYIYPDDAKKKEQRNEGKAAGYAAAAKAASKPTTTSGTKNPTVSASQVTVKDTRDGKTIGYSEAARAIGEGSKKAEKEHRKKVEKEIEHAKESAKAEVQKALEKFYNSTSSQSVDEYWSTIDKITEELGKPYDTYRKTTGKIPPGFEYNLNPSRYVQKLISEETQNFKGVAKHSAFSMSDEEFYKYTGKNIATT